ncbi:MAG: SCO family protein [Rhodobacteraceae bacterium]|nr:SCO family protein [Paracoccaceae bacterium]
MSRIRLILWALVAFAVAAVSTITLYRGQNPALQVTVVDGRIKPFSLIGPGNQLITNAHFRGKWMLLFFGYTHCPDICPTTMLTIASVLNDLGDEAVKLQPIFITIDPERDSPALLKDYLANFDSRILGLGGDEQRVAEAAEAFGVFYRKQPIDNSDGDYYMDHSTALYLVDPDGRLARPYVPDVPPGELAEKLRVRFRTFEEK